MSWRGEGENGEGKAEDGERDVEGKAEDGERDVEGIKCGGWAEAGDEWDITNHSIVNAHSYVHKHTKFLSKKEINETNCVTQLLVVSRSPCYTPSQFVA